MLRRGILGRGRLGFVCIVEWTSDQLETEIDRGGCCGCGEEKEEVRNQV